MEAAPVMPAPVEASPMMAPQMEAAPAAIPQLEAGPVIYGGASPTVAPVSVAPETHQIYGGADPLQNTQTIPKIVTSAEAVTSPIAPPTVAQPAMTVPQVSGVAPVAPVAPVNPIQ